MSCSIIFNNFFKTNIVCGASLYSDQWVNTDTVFLIFSCVSAGCGCHYSDEDEGRLVCDQLCQTPLCQTHSRSLFVLPNIPMTSSVCRVRKMSQWCSALSENHKICAWQTRAGVCLFLVLFYFLLSFSLFPTLSLYPFSYSLYFPPHPWQLASDDSVLLQIVCLV